MSCHLTAQVARYRTAARWARDEPERSEPPNQRLLQRRLGRPGIARAGQPPAQHLARTAVEDDSERAPSVPAAPHLCQVRRPAPVRCRRHRGQRPRPRPMPPAALPHLPAPALADPLHHLAVPAEDGGDPAIAIRRITLDHGLDRPGFVGINRSPAATRPVVEAAPRDPEPPTQLAERDPLTLGTELLMDPPQGCSAWPSSRSNFNGMVRPPFSIYRVRSRVPPRHGAGASDRGWEEET